MKDFLAMIAGLFLIVAAFGLVGIGLDAAGLLYLPFAYHQQTVIVHNSQGYIDAQRDQLRAFKADYDTATNETDKAAALRQMQELADHLNRSDIQPDIAALLGR